MARGISVAMIVKDEAEQLDECLASIADLAGEIRIVDTGSRDNTVEIARKHNAAISFFIWCDDFSAARNESLRCCSGDWVFVVDADERVAPGDLRAIRALAEGQLDCCYRFTTRNYTNTTTVGEFTACEPGDPHARGFDGWYPSVKIRLFPNGIGARFEGQVHENVLKSMEARHIQVKVCGVPIHHYPFLKPPERILAKQELYLELGRQKIADAPDDPNAYAELGNQFADAGDYASAAAAYRESLRRDTRNATVMKDLGAALHLLNRGEEAKHALRLSLHLDPSCAETWRNLGVVFSCETEWGLALECFKEALARNPSWPEGYRYLSTALEATGDYADAAEASGKALAAAPDSAEALRLYIHQMLRLEKRAEARAFIVRLLDAGADSPVLHNAVGELFFYDDMFDEAVRHFRTAGKQGLPAAYNNLGVVYYRLQDYADAKRAFECCIGADPGHKGALANLQKVMGQLEAE